MRIFFVTNNYTPYSGGVTNSIIATTNALRAQGHEVFIVTLDFLGKNWDPDYVIRLTCPIKFMYKKNHLAIPWRPTHTITQLLKQYNPDIVHVHHPFLLGVSALHAARKLNIPCVFTYHTMYEQYAHYVPLPALCTKPLIRTTVARFCNTVDGIIAPSNGVKEYLHSQQITSPITMIPSPLRPSFLTSAQSLHPPVAQLSSSSVPFKLLVVSRFVPEKNIPFVFDVFKKLPDIFTLTLVGYGSDYEHLQQLAFETLRLPQERVRFIHKPCIDKLLNLYRNADLCIFSSTTDTQGLVLAESMSQDLPVIAVDGPGQRDIIVNGYNGFIIENAQHAATTVMNIANNPSLHNHLRS
ncbi:MAG TPA: glycosyltransferase, partial [Candidatus Babeliales bacterium]|nr:glycosyltransferase [Candidatus Babeliales bacterium]